MKKMNSQNPQSFKVLPFEMKNIPQILDVVVPMWSPPVGDAEFKRFNVEYIVRNNIFENDMRFELLAGESDNAGQTELSAVPGEFCSAAFFTRKGEVCKAAEWYDVESKKFPAELGVASEMSKTYIELMDKKTQALMNDDDIQLTLYVSRKPGCGSLLLNELCARLKNNGYKNLFLWTDIECNWEWYVKNGYELMQQESYEPFSEEHEDYKTFIFRKSL